MMYNITNQFTSITDNEETYIYDKINKIFTFIDTNKDIIAFQVETKKDVTELYKELKENAEILGEKISLEFNEWFQEILTL